MSSKLSIATYNVLADAYVRPEFYPLVDPKLFVTEARYPRIVERVAGFGTHVICLQEVDWDLHQLLTERLEPLGYRGAWAKKDGGKPDGCSTFYRAPWKLRVLTHRFYKDGSADRKASGHVMLLTVIQNDDQRISIVNTHLKWHPPDALPEDRIGLTQARELIEMHAGLPNQRIICADFNAQPGSDILSVFHEAGYENAHPGEEPTFNSFHDGKGPGRPMKIDHILHTAGLTAEAHPVPTLTPETGLPNDAEPSDHLPLIATLLLE